MNDHNEREIRYRTAELRKINGRQGETIHRLRAELAEVRELNSKVDRGRVRALEAEVQSLLTVIDRQAEVITELREKLRAATDVNEGAPA